MDMLCFQAFPPYLISRIPRSPTAPFVLFALLLFNVPVPDGVMLRTLFALDGLGERSARRTLPR